MNHVRCSRCGRRLTRPGAILLGPPHPQDLFVRTMPICSPCFVEVDDEIEDHSKVNLGDVDPIPEPVF